MADSALALLSALVLEDGRRWGDAAATWQRADAAAVLGGPRRLCYLTRPRGGSKTTDLAGVGIAALLEQLPAGSRSYAVAADRDQGQLLLDAIDGFASRTPGLAAALRIDSWKVTAATSGATLEILAADAASSWGLRPHLLIVDERANWRTTPEPERLWRALFSALPKVPTSRLVILTSAGDPAHPAGRLLERARKSERWYVNEVPGPCPWLDPDDLAEQQAELPAWEYERLVLNRWTAPADRLTTVDDLGACVTLDGPLPHDGRWRYVVAVDIGLRHDRTVVCVCHSEPVTRDEGLGFHPTTTGHRIVLDRMRVWQGTRRQPVQLSIVEDYIAQASHLFGHARVVYDPWQAEGMAQRLRSRGLSLTEFTFSAQSVGRLGATLHQLIRNHALALPGDAELIDELANVRLRERAPGVLRMDHDRGRHDDRAVALALAAHHLLELPMAPSWSVIEHNAANGASEPIVGNLFGVDF